MIHQIVETKNLVNFGRMSLAYCLDKENLSLDFFKGRPWSRNMVCSGAATAIANLVTGSLDGKSYRIGAMYLEYENNSGAAVSVPDDGDIDRTETIEYYNNLPSNRDYLRVPILAGTVTSSDDDVYPLGNVTTFYAQSAGTAGILGRPFTSGAQSRIYGAALVVTPEYEDPSQDLIYARVYFQSANQLIKTIGAQIAGAWEHQYS